jgi:hypothetical protein
VTVTPDQKEQNKNEKVELMTPTGSGSIVGLAKEETAPEETDS